MSFDEFRTLVESYDLSNIGLDLVSHTSRDEVDEVFPGEKVLSYLSKFRNSYVEVTFTFCVDTCSIYVTIIKTPSEYFNIHEYLRDKGRRKEHILLEKKKTESQLQYVDR